MKAFLKLCGTVAVYLAKTLLSFAIWSVWLVLAIMLVFQIWIYSNRQMAVPGFVLRSLEEQLAASQIRVNFRHTEFDPTGRILVRDVKLMSPAFAEPLATAQAVYVELDPWALLAGRFEAREFRASGVSTFVPAMFSASGSAEPLVEDVDLVVLPREKDIEIRQLDARVGNLVVSAHGVIRLPKLPPTKGASSSSVADFIARKYPPLSRHLAGYMARLNRFEEPRLDLLLSPSETAGTIVTATVSARRAQIDYPLALEAVDVIAQTRFPATGETEIETRFDVSAAHVRLPRDVQIENVRANLRGTLRTVERTFEPHEAELDATQVTAAGLVANALAARAQGSRDAVHADITARIASAAVELRAEADLQNKLGRIQVVSTVSNTLVAAVSTFAKRDLSKWIQFGAPARVDADLRFSSGWRIASIDGRAATRELTVRGVPLDGLTGRFYFAGGRLEASDIVLRQRENIARGSYTVDNASRDFRFLLTGSLRPLDIAPWFREWWPKFFRDFDFAAAIPNADVDVRGRWGDARATNLFISADAQSPVIRTVALDQARVVLFIRPHHYDAREFVVSRGAGEARGRFVRRLDPTLTSFRDLEFQVASNLEVAPTAPILGKVGLDIARPFRLAHAPRLKVDGRITGPADPEGEHQIVHIEGESTGAFHLFEFPLNDVSFTADLRDADLLIHRAKVGFAGGSGSGSGRVRIRGSDPRATFEYTLKEANLGQAIIATENFAALRQKAPPPTKSAFVEKAGDVRLDLRIAAEGLYEDPYSFRGEGNAELNGPQLGEVRLLGLLSELLNFTSLRFTTMRTNFRLEGNRLAFPDVKLTGANSMIDAKGTYALDRKQLDFTAKVFPFAESRFVPQALIGVVLSPLSQVLEVKLTGSLVKPEWAFALGPTNFLRSIMSPAGRNAPQPPEAPAEKPVSPYLKR